MISFALEIWHVKFLRFSPCMTARWRHDKAVVLEKKKKKKGFYLEFLELQQFKYWGKMFLCLSTSS